MAPERRDGVPAQRVGTSKRNFISATFGGRGLFLLALCAILTLLIAGCNSEPEVDTFFESPEYGVHSSFWWKRDIVWRDLDLLQEMGFGWVKQTVAWRDVENHVEKGAFDWYRLDEQIIPEVEKRDLKILVRLDRPPRWAYYDTEPLGDNGPPLKYEDFGEFCGTVAARFKGRIDAYQVWNEPNLHREWGLQPPDPVEYTALLKACYEQIKANDPDAIVISAGLAPTGTHNETATPDTIYLQGMYDAGAADYFDVLGLNAPGYKAPPDLAPEDVVSTQGLGDQPFFAFRHVETMRQIMIDNGDEQTQVALLEMGWITDDPANEVLDAGLETYHPDYAWFAVTPEQQAEYLVGAYQYARENWTPWIGLMTTVYFSDFDWDAENYEQWWWSIVLPDGTKRPAFDALKAMEK